MTTLLQNSALLVLAFVCLAAGRADAQTQQGFEVFFDAPPVAGEPLGVEVKVLEAEPVRGRIFYRPTGAATYASVAPTLTENTFRLEIPAEAMTIRGLEVYGEYEDEQEVTRTFPIEDAADNPLSIQIFIGTVESEVVLPPRGYRMVAMPVELGNDSALRVFADDFGAPDPNRFRIVRWNPTLDQYEDAPEAPDQLSGGTAFWVIASNGGSFDTDGATSTLAELQAIELEPGCNQIGNPFAFPVAWADVQNGELVEPPVVFDGTGYVFDQAVLDPWVGYFVCNPTGQPVTLGVPPREAGTTRPAMRSSATYSVRLRAEAGSYQEATTLVGFAPDAADGRDRLDRTALPPVGEHVRVQVVEPERRLARSLKSEQAEGAAWELEVAASPGVLGGASQRVTLALDEAGVRPAAFGLHVIDTAAGTALPIRNGKVEVVLRPDAPRRRLRLIAGTEAFAQNASAGASLDPFTFGLDTIYPNPFTEEAMLGYRLPAPGAVALEVFDLLGRRVRVLADGHAEAGHYAARWDGRDASGRPVASGLYLIRLRTSDATATRRVSVVR